MKSIELRHNSPIGNGIPAKQSKSSYNGEALPGQVWSWPKNTYLQRRLRGYQYVTETHLTEKVR